MKIIIKDIESIEIYNLEILELEQFLNQNHAAESFAWCNGYLLTFTFFSDKIFDAGILEGIWKYKAVDVCETNFKTEIQARYTKVPVYDMSKNKIMIAITQQLPKQEFNWKIQKMTIPEV